MDNIFSRPFLIMNDKKSALALRLGGLGDVLVALPSMNLLRNTLPGLSLDFVGREEYGRLLQDAGVARTVFSAANARWIPLFRDTARVPRETVQWLDRYDPIVGWFQNISVRHHFTRKLSSLSPRLFFFTYDPDSGLTISRYFFNLTAELVQKDLRAGFVFEDCCFLPLKKAQGETGRKFLPTFRPDSAKKIAVVHPGSGSPKKCWPLERFLGIISFLDHKGFRGALVTGEAEEKLEAEISKIILPQDWIWLRRPPLMPLAGLLHSAVLYVGNDSGITHLAAACGTRVIALFRREFETAWKPFGRTLVLSADDIATLPLDKALEAISGVLE